MQPPDSPYAGPRSSVAPPPPSFGERLLLLPIAPAFWRRCADLAFADVAAPLLVLAFGVGIATGLLTAPRVQSFLHEAATHYDENADPLVYESGRFRLDGDRILFWQQDEVTILIDPERTVPDAEVSGLQYAIVRDDEVILQQLGQPQERHAAEELAPLLGEEPVVIEGRSIRAFADRVVYPVVIGFMAVFGTLAEFISCLVYAAIGGAIARLVRGQWLGLGFAACFQVALGASAATLVAGLVLAAFQIVSPVPGVILWPAVITVLTLWALGQGDESPTLPESQ